MFGFPEKMDRQRLRQGRESRENFSEKRKEWRSGMKNENTTGIQQSGGKLGWGTRVAYGCGDTACNVVFGMISTLLTLFYTDYVGISAAR